MNKSLQELEVIRNAPVLFGYREEDFSHSPIHNIKLGGLVEYNPQTKAEELVMNMTNSQIKNNIETYFSFVGHELKHLYQFSQGQLGSSYYEGQGWGASGLSDYYDEYDAFVITHSISYRGGDLEADVLSSMNRFPYNTLPKMHIDLSTSAYEAHYIRTGVYFEPNKGKSYEQLMREKNEKTMKEGNYLKFRFLGDGYW